MDQDNSTQRSETGSLTGNTIFVGSSRLPQKLDTIPQFFAGLLKLAVQLDPRRDVLITADGTACDKFVTRIGELFDVPVVRLNPERGLGADSELAKMADRMTVLSMRKKGNLHAAVLHRLQEGKPTRVLLEPSLVHKSLVDELLGLGATGWYLLPENSDDQNFKPESPSTVNAKDVDSSKYLLHWTRRRVGPWPDQSEQEFIDDLLFGFPRKDHREIATLRRILATGRILSSNGLTRDARPVVCFSDISFEQLLDQRVFRRHLSRWDFEPFGIAIAKSWLSQHGAEAVRYGDESLWESMSESDRPFFQHSAHDSKVDWSIENEWRIIGDVDLKRVPSDAAVVFVPNPVAAAEICEFSRWPVVVLDEKLTSKRAEDESAG